MLSNLQSYHNPENKKQIKKTYDITEITMNNHQNSYMDYVKLNKSDIKKC
jgi:hypothetical protein